jgi:hypothetical protein
VRQVTQRQIGGRAAPDHQGVAGQQAERPTADEVDRSAAAGNALVIGGGAATYLALRNLAHLSPQAIGAVCGCVISAGLLVALVFEGWPGALLHRLGAGRAVTLVCTAVVAVVLNRALAGYADSVHWVRATANDWVTVAGLAFSAVGIILHVAIGQRWPLSPTIADEDTQQQPARATR